MNLLPIGQTSCPGRPNPLPSVSSSSPATLRFASIFFFFPKTATTPTQQHHEDVFPSSSSSPTQQHHEDALMHWCSPLSSSLNHEDAASRGTICYLPPSTAPKMKIIDSGNGGFLQPSLFLKAFEKLKGSRTHRFVKSSRVFFLFS